MSPADATLWRAGPVDRTEVPPAASGGGEPMDSDIDRDYVEYVSTRLPVLHRAAYLLCGDGHHADDIVQSTLLALYRHWRRARAADNTDAYVQRMLVRKFLDERR